MILSKKELENYKQAKQWSNERFEIIENKDYGIIEFEIDQGKTIILNVTNVLLLR